jgi:antitoxin component YwqK of YwqJK toxin-antitoxin module
VNVSGDWVYEGDFRNGLRHGKGKEKWPKEHRKNWSSELECNYVDGLRNGIGTWYFNNHTYDKCVFKNGEQIKVIETGTWK